MSGSLRSLSDNEMLSRTDMLMRQSRKLTLNLLLHLNEIERRKLYLKRGYGSMFDYCTAHLRLSESGAIRRVRTARCLARFPELAALLEAGDVNLSTITQVSRILNSDNSSVILARIRGRSQREVQSIVAEYEPCAALPPDRVRTVVMRVPVSTSTTNCQENYRRNGGEIDPVAGEIKAQTEASPNERTEGSVAVVTFKRRALVQFTASEEFMAKVEQVRRLASHRLPANASLEQVLELGLDLFIEREDPSRRRERRRERAVVAQRPGTPPGTRYIPARVRDEVFARDQGRCTFKSPDGRRCGSKYVLQFDHIQPIARGGESTPENLRLLCAYHNRLEAERLMGVRRNTSGVREQRARYSLPMRCAQYSALTRTHGQPY